MEEKLSTVLTLCSQLKTLRNDVDKIRPEHAMMPGSGSGITVYIPHFNSILEKTRQLFQIDPTDQRGSQLLGAIGSVEPIKEMEERLDVSYHQRAKQRILAGSGMLLEALEEYRQSATEESTPVTQTKEFTFVNSPELRKILERDYIEIQRAFIAQCWKSVIILSGGAIEAILMDFLLQNPSTAQASVKAPKGKPDISRWDFADLINVSVDLGLASNGVEKLSHSVRDYRNLIHPGNEIRNKLTFNAEEAKIALEVLHIVHRDCS